MRPDSLIGENRAAMLAELAASTPPGHFVEVGVYKGGSAWWLARVARERGCELHLFDTFTGIPFHDPDDSNGTGDFADTSVDAVKAAIPDASFHIGIFPDTLPDDLRNVAFIHCDCDQYRSVKSVIERMWPLVVPGGVMAFDDVDTNGGKRAISEAFEGELTLSHGWFCVRKST